MNELMLFKNEEFGEIRGVEIEGKPYVVANDVLKALGYAEGNWRTTLSRKCKYVAKCNVPHPQNTEKNIEVNVISEGDIYRLIFSSKLPSAQKFEEWVMDEVLPQIRKTGGYIPLSEDDDENAIMAKALIIAQKTLDKKNELIKNMQPKVEYFDALVDRNLLTSFRDTAKEFHIRQKDFINWLLENNFIYRDSNNKIKPTAQALEEGLFELKEFTNEHFSSTQTLITPKGRETFRLLLEKDNKLI